MKGIDKITNPDIDWVNNIFARYLYNYFDWKDTYEKSFRFNKYILLNSFCYFIIYSKLSKIFKWFKVMHYISSLNNNDIQINLIFIHV